MQSINYSIIWAQNRKNGSFFSSEIRDSSRSETTISPKIIKNNSIQVTKLLQKPTTNPNRVQDRYSQNQSRLPPLSPATKRRLKRTPLFSVAWRKSPRDPAGGSSRSSAGPASSRTPPPGSASSAEGGTATPPGSGTLSSSASPSLLRSQPLFLALLP